MFNLLNDCEKPPQFYLYLQIIYNIKFPSSFFSKNVPYVSQLIIIA